MNVALLFRCSGVSNGHGVPDPHLSSQKSIVVTQLSSLLSTFADIQMDKNSEMGTGFQTPTLPPKSELALQKGFCRRTWTGPAWLNNVTSIGHVSIISHLVLLCC